MIDPRIKQIKIGLVSCGIAACGEAVYKDLKRACKLFRLPKELNITSHTARKIYAVKRWNGKRAPKYMTDILGHSSEPVAMLYTMADLITLKQHPELKNYILNSTMR